MFGLLIKNDASELVVDASTKGLHYFGMATFAGTQTFSDNSRWYNRYSVTLPSSAHTPFVAIKLATDRLVAVQQVFRSSPGSSTWYIDTYAVDTSSTGRSSIHDTPAISVHVWTQWFASGYSYSLRFFDPATHVATWDFAAKPLFVRQVMNFAAGTNHATQQAGDSQPLLAGISQPALAYAGHGKDNNAVGAVGSHDDSEYLFSIDGAGNVIRRRAVTFWEPGEPGGSPYTPQPDWSLPAAQVFIYDLANYL